MELFTLLYFVGIAGVSVIERAVLVVVKIENITFIRMHSLYSCKMLL